MRILLATVTFSRLTHGPSRGAQLLLRASRELGGEQELRILTEDPVRGVDDPGVYALQVDYPRRLEVASKLIRMLAYARAAYRIHAVWPFDWIVFNDGVQAMGLAAWKSRTFRVAAIVRDDDNLSWSRRPYEGLKRTWWRRAFGLLEGVTAHLADATLANSDYTAARLRSVYRLPALPRVVRPGINPGEFSQRSALPDDGRHTLLFVKSDPLRGGLLVLRDALRRLSTPARERVRKVIFAGFDDPDLRAQVRSWAIVDYEFHGLVDRPTFRSLVSASTIGVVPSLHEAFGLTSVEYQLAGLTTVLAEVGGLPETVLPGANVLTFRPQHGAEGLCRALEQALDEAPRRRPPPVYTYDYQAMYRTLIAALRASYSAVRTV